MTVLARIGVPTRLVWGDADELVGRDMQMRLAQTIGGAELLVYRGVGHTPRWENPSRFASDVAAFVAESSAKQRCATRLTSCAATRQNVTRNVVQPAAVAAPERHLAADATI